jgi:hypothetical protein
VEGRTTNLDAFVSVVSIGFVGGFAAAQPMEAKTMDSGSCAAAFIAYCLFVAFGSFACWKFVGDLVHLD